MRQLTRCSLRVFSSQILRESFNDTSEEGGTKIGTYKGWGCYGKEEEHK